jgi:hypothetical protein
MIRAMTFQFCGTHAINVAETKQIMKEMREAEAGKVFKFFFLLGGGQNRMIVPNMAYLECVILDKTKSKLGQDFMLFDTVRCTYRKKINGIGTDGEGTYNRMVEATPDGSRAYYDLQGIFRAPEDAAVTEQLIAIVSKFTDLCDEEMAKEYFSLKNRTYGFDYKLREFEKTYMKQEKSSNKRVKISADAEDVKKNEADRMQLIIQHTEAEAKVNIYHHILLEKAYGIYEEFQTLLNA